MRQRAFIFLLLSSLLLNSCSKKSTGTNAPVNNNPSPPVTEKPYSLVWADEFDKAGVPDATKWGFDIGGSGWGNNELQYYTDRPQNVRVEAGNLIIEAKKENFLNRGYTSARVLSKNKMAWTYGKFEIRAKLPKGIGTWPAIWLLSANNPLNWPDDGELDIMEEVGFNPNVIHGTVHNKLYNGANGQQKGGSIKIADAQDAFHVYGLEWTDKVISWWVDSTNYFSYYNSYGAQAWPYYKDFFMILNIAIGGNWGGQQGVDDSIFPQQLLIDYVRVYQRK